MKHCCIIFKALKNPNILFYLTTRPVKKQMLDFFFFLSQDRKINIGISLFEKTPTAEGLLRTKQFMNLPLPKMMFLLEYSDVVGIYFHYLYMY